MSAQPAITPRARATDGPSVAAIAADPTWRRRFADALTAHGLAIAAEGAAIEAAIEAAAVASTVVVLACDIDAPRQMAALRRLRREAASAGIVVVSPPVTGTGVRRALDAGADAVVFEPECEQALTTAVHGVANGQSVVPRKVRASLEKPVLSHRENEVLVLVADGLTNAEIAENLFLAESTIKSHLASIFTKLGVRSRKEVAVALVELDVRPSGPRPSSQPASEQALT